MTYLICAQEKAAYFWRRWERRLNWAECREAQAIESVLRQTPVSTLFFAHWSSKVPAEITDNYTCINFHCTDLPYGRGCCPVQNLILRGKTETMVTAHLMTSEYDAGDILCKRPMSLLGGGDEIYDRLGALVVDMVHDIAANLDMYMAGKISQAEEGKWKGLKEEPFEKRGPHQSVIWSSNVPDAFDFIRCHDAEGYPSAFTEIAGLRYTFSNPVLRPDGIEAHVKITEVDDAGR